MVADLQCHSYDTVPDKMFQPEYTQGFRCIGSRCEQNCCGAGWGIYIDKAAYKKCRATPSLRQAAKEFIQINPSAHDNFQFALVTTIQVDTKGAVEAIGSITTVITQVSDISGTIATAVEEQSATTREMSRNVTEAARGLRDHGQHRRRRRRSAWNRYHRTRITESIRIPGADGDTTPRLSRAIQNPPIRQFSTRSDRNSRRHESRNRTLNTLGNFRSILDARALACPRTSTHGVCLALEPQISRISLISNLSPRQHLERSIAGLHFPTLSS